MFDVAQFRTENKDFLLEQIYQMADQQHQVVKHLMASVPWDFLCTWTWAWIACTMASGSSLTPRHPKHEPGNPYEHAIRDYYMHIDAPDRRAAGPLDDDTAVLVVSDHGGQPMMGGICFNEWLKQEGYLVLEHQPRASFPWKSAR
jgi:predicted AlkP superfamily phosphohydrolase/phosphomutase